MKKTILFSFLCCSWMLSAQDVDFTNMSQLLSPVSNGFTYNDCAVDMNGDYLDDVVRIGFDGIYIDYQQPDGSFDQTYFATPFQNEPDWSICAGDLDGNGFNDLLFGGGNAVSFVYANNDGTDYTEQMHPLFIFSQRSNMVDIDNDGHLDAFVCHDTDQSHAYRNDGQGNMIYDPSLIETFDRPGNYASIWVDYDNDGDTDLYVAKCKGGSFPGDVDRTNLLYRNNADGTFTEVGTQAGVADNAQSWSTVFEDFDNDGDFDAFVVNHDFENRFYMNNGDGTFTGIIDSTGIAPNDLGAWENASGDFNNDGYMDIFSEMSKRLYLGNGDLTFEGTTIPVTPGGTGDFNDDGFLDVVKNNNLWLNNGNDNNWLKVNTVGLKSNSNGIGARVEIYGAWGRQIREVRSGQSFAPMSSLQIHFGLGDADVIDQIIVKWPSGITTVLDTPSVNTTLIIHEATCILPPSQITVSGSTDICPGDSVEMALPDGFAYEWANGDTAQSISVSGAGAVFAFLTDTAGCISFTQDVEVTSIEEVAPVIGIAGFQTFCEGGSVVLSTEEENPMWSNGSTAPSILVDASGEYTVSVEAICQQDPLVSEAVIVTEIIPELPVVTNVNILQGETAEIMATGNNLEWYDMETDGIVLGTGNTFITDPLDMTTTYFVESHEIYLGEKQSGGKPDFQGGGGTGSTAFWSYFDAWEPFTLDSVLVRVTNANNAGETTIQLVDVNGNVLQDTVVELGVGDQQIHLGFEVPVDDSLSLRNPESNLFRNNNGVAYPYPIGDVGEITTSILGNNLYYFFYDWKISIGATECISDRVPATVEVTDAHEAFLQAGFTIFPNPAHAGLFVKMDNPAERIVLLNAQGQVVFEKAAKGSGTEKLDIDELSAGMYFIKIESEGKTYQTKFVKE